MDVDSERPRPVPRPRKNKCTGIDKFRIFIENIHPRTTNECLFDFLEGRSNATPEEILREEIRGTALVKFSEEPDMECLEKGCQKRKVEGNYLRISPVEKPKSVIISGLPVNVTSDAVQYTLENPKRGIGANVEKVDIIPSTGETVVFFSNFKDAEKACDPSLNVKVEGSKIGMKLYYPCLSSSHLHQQFQRTHNDTKMNQKFPVDIDYYILKFLQRSEEYYKKLQEELQQINAKLVVETMEGTKVRPFVECETSENCEAFIKHANTLILDFIKKNGLISRSVSTESSLHPQINKELKMTLQELNQKVNVFKMKNDLIIVGEMEAVQTILDKIQTFVKNLTQKDVVELKAHQMKLLFSSKYEHRLRRDFPNLKIRYDCKLNTIEFEGHQSDITDAKLKVHTHLDGFLRADVNLEKKYLSLLEEKETQTYLEDILAKMDCCADFKEHVVTVYALDNEVLKKAQDVIKESIVEKTICVTGDFSGLPEWIKLNKSLRDTYAGKVLMDESENGIITLVATQDIADDIKTEINDYFSMKHFKKETFSLPKPIYKYFKEHKQDKIHSIADNLYEEKVKISFGHKDLYISGTASGIKKADDELRKLESQVSSKTYKIKQPGLKELLTQECGKDAIMLVEKKKKCIIVPETEFAENTDSTENMKKTWSIGNKTVRVCLGNITTQEVDAIVNAANVKLDHAGGIASDIVQKGGAEIQNQCEQYISENGPLSDSDVYTSTAGQLPCKAVIHAVGPRWQDGNNSEDKDLENTVVNILKEANKQHFTSLAIPALSSGIFGYPPNKAVKVIVTALQEFRDEDQNEETLREVCFCDSNKKTVKAFVDVLDENILDGNSDSTDDDDTGNDSDTEGLHHSSEQLQDVVEIVQGDLADQEVDVLVSPINQDFDLSGNAVSKSLLQKYGKALQRECYKKYKNGLDFEDIAVVDSSYPPRQKIFFGCLKKWDQKGQAQKILGEFVTSCLDLVAKEQLSSVAFPPLGTGRLLGFPADIAATLLQKAVKLHFKNNPSSTVKNIICVVYPQNTDVLQAFKNIFEENSYSEIEDLPKQVKHSQANGRHSSNHDQFLCGNIKVHIVRGDITLEKTECIVNSTNSTLDLNTGAVSKTILAKAGPELQSYCEERIEDMKANGVVLTEAGNLNCQYILHIKAQKNNDGWFKILTKGLNLVDQQGIASLSIPALGTGGQKGSAERLADVIAKAIKKFSDSKRYSSLKQIRLVIFHGYMIPAFKSAFSGQRNSSSRHRHGCRDVKLKRSSHSWKQSLSEECVIAIYAEGDHVLVAAKEAFIEQCKKIFDDKTLPENLCGNFGDLPSEEKRAVYEIAKKCKVQLSMSQNKLVKITGAREDVLKAYEKISEKLLQIKTAADKKQEAKVVANLVQWYYIDRHGESQAFSRGINAKLEKAYQTKERFTEVTDPKGRLYKVDLKKMEEYPQSGKNVKINISRCEKQGPGQSKLVKGEKEALSGNKTVYFSLHAERAHKNTAEEHHFRTAESQFLRLLESSAHYRVDKVEYVVNPVLMKKFRAAQQNLKKTRGEDMSYPVLAFHGTNTNNIKKICEAGFLAPGDPGFVMKSGNSYGSGVYFSEYPSYSMRYISGATQLMLCQVLIGKVSNLPMFVSSGDRGFQAKTDSGYYGAGVYFSEYPEYSMAYINGSTTIMLCQILQGKAYTCQQVMSGANLQAGYDSHVSPCGKELVIFNTSHILPSYIVYYSQK